jgi:hypothetical protein
MGSVSLMVHVNARRISAEKTVHNYDVLRIVISGVNVWKANVNVVMDTPELIVV